jgi:hypothetical protein
MPQRVPSPGTLAKYGLVAFDAGEHEQDEIVYEGCRPDAGHSRWCKGRLTDVIEFDLWNRQGIRNGDTNMLNHE